MIVTKPAAALRLVTQPDHARVAAELLSLWREDGLPEHPRREELLFAAREHDNGWQETDAAPRIDPASGRPYGFRELPARLRIDLWARGVERHLAEHRYPALLIATHADRIHSDRRGQPDWQAFFDQLDRLIEELQQSSGATPEELADDYRWLRLADQLSLVACGDNPALDLDGRKASRQDGRILLDPFPFAGATTFTVPSREIPDRPYGSDTDLTVELATARWTSFKVQLAPV